MAMCYESLDQKTREFMLREVDKDIAEGSLYISPRLNELGAREYAALVREAVQEHDDAFLATELRGRGCLRTHEYRTKPKGGFTTAAVPVTAADTLAEGEFNRFYIRGLCARVLAEGGKGVEVCRGKAVRQPRPESEIMIGKMVPAEALLGDLRRSPGVEPALGLPPGPNSGLTVRLPRT